MTLPIQNMTLANDDFKFPRSRWPARSLRLQSRQASAGDGLTVTATRPRVRHHHDGSAARPSHNCAGPAGAELGPNTGLHQVKKIQMSFQNKN